MITETQFVHVSVWFHQPLLIFVFPILQDAAAAVHHSSSDSALSDYQPPAKRKYVLKNKANASAATFSRGLFHFCH